MAMTLDEAREHLREEVVYDNGHSPAERGVISSVGRENVFVRFGADYFGRATDPASLTLATPGTR